MVSCSVCKYDFTKTNDPKQIPKRLKDPQQNRPLSVSTYTYVKRNLRPLNRF